MTATAQELLDRFAEIGASVRPGGEDRLVVRAGARPVPAALVRQLREAKAQIMAALASGLEPQAGDAGDSDPDLVAAAFHQSHHPLGAERLSVSRRSRGTRVGDLAGEDAGATYPLRFGSGCAAPKSVNSVSAADALRAARAGGNKLGIDGDDLVLEACAPPPTVVLDLLSRHKAEIVWLLLPGRDGWSAQDWQVFFDQRVDICKLDGLLPREQAEARAVAWCLAEWLNRNPMRSPPGRCFGCGGGEQPLDPLLPFGIGTDGRVWLHSRCQPAWHSGRKAEAIAALAAMGIVAPAAFPEDFGKDGAHACDERAAIVELGAGVPRAWAEGYAALCGMPPPAGFLPGRWHRIVDAVGVFVDRWAAKAAACGWSDLDVFGCNPDRPDARFDCMGIVLLLDRCEVVGVDELGADVVTNTGVRQRFYRRPLPPGTISLWQLQR